MRPTEGLAGFIGRLAGRRPVEEDERLLELFRNRTELKRELNALAEERHQLLDRLKLQQGATMRVEEQLDRLQQYLGRPEHAQKCLVHFQLHGLWRAGASRLQRFADDLRRQQQERERRQQLARFESTRSDRLYDTDRELHEARALVDQLQAEQKLRRQRLAALRGFWNVLPRRRLRDEVAAQDLRVATAVEQMTALERRRAQIEAEPQPPPAAIGLEGRRAVNLAVIAAAQWITDVLVPADLAMLAREATLKRVFDAEYGGDSNCERLRQRIAAVLATLEGGDDLAALKLRTDGLRRSARYRREADSTPTAESVGAHAGAAPGTRAINVLLEEYWELPRALLVP